MALNLNHYRRQNLEESSRNLIICTSDGRPIAELQRDQFGRLFSKKRLNSKKHFLRTPPGIAYDTAALEQAERLGVEYHVVFDRDTNKTYCAEHWLFEKHGFPVCRGFNPQIGLGKQFWTEGDQPPMSLFDVTQTPMMGVGVAA